MAMRVARRATVAFIFLIAPQLFPGQALNPSRSAQQTGPQQQAPPEQANVTQTSATQPARTPREDARSEEHTSELQSRGHLVCRLLLEKKKTEHEEGGHAADHAAGAGAEEQCARERKAEGVPGVIGGANVGAGGGGGKYVCSGEDSASR